VVVLVVRELTMPRSRPRACRCLFGRPDPGDVDRFLQETEAALQHLTDEASLRWDFDFRAGRPLDDIPGKSRRYEWTPVTSWNSVPPDNDKVFKSSEKVESTTVIDTLADISRSAADVTHSVSDAIVCHASSLTTTTESPSAANSQDNPPTNYADAHNSSRECDSK